MNLEISSIMKFISYFVFPWGPRAISAWLPKLQLRATLGNHMNTQWPPLKRLAVIF